MLSFFPFIFYFKLSEQKNSTHLICFGPPLLILSKCLRENFLIDSGDVDGDVEDGGADGVKVE